MPHPYGVLYFLFMANPGLQRRGNDDPQRLHQCRSGQAQRPGEGVQGNRGLQQGDGLGHRDAPHPQLVRVVEEAFGHHHLAAEGRVQGAQRAEGPHGP